jgi:PAS domain S-box-containing protein
MSQERFPVATPNDKYVQEFIERLSDIEIAPYWLAAIIESADDAIISKTLEGIITSWNRGAERMFGYAATEAIGQSVTILIPPDHQDEEPAIITRLKRGERIEHYETVRVRKDGALLDISLTVSPIRGADGTIIGASKIARDISERKQVEARLQEALAAAHEARTQAEEANRLRDEFLAIVSHELRTPLTSILGWVQLLRKGDLDEASARSALETIHRNVKIQAQLVEDLLDVSKVMGGKMRLQVKPLELSSVINAAVNTIMPAAEARGVRLQTIIDPSAGPVAGDHERLQQVMWNLLSNAVKFTPPGGWVQVHLERADGGVRVVVRDSGKGIKPAFLPLAFERFTQEDSSSTRAFGGMGMGLAIVKSIVELHGGTVRAFSAGEGQGTTFTVSLPVAKAWRNSESSERTVAEPPDDALLDCPPELDELKILVVDDDFSTCEMVRTTFEQCGARVKMATSAVAALAQMEEWLPDILVADINMPEMDGYQLMEQIRIRDTRAGGKVPAVALTAMARIEDRMKTLTAGYQMHVAKPVELSELRAVVASLAGVIIKER